MKTFPSKVEWIAEHQNGDKCYYYPGTGWISAHDGLVTGFGLSDAPAIPEDATHVQFIQGKVQFIRHGDATCVDIWRNGAWHQACTLQKLPGTAVRIKDGDVLGPPVAHVATAEVAPKAALSHPWYLFDAMTPVDTENSIRMVEIQFKDRTYSTMKVRDVCWNPLTTEVDRWRYAS